jgi:hypothetical protein
MSAGQGWTEQPSHRVIGNAARDFNPSARVLFARILI